MYFSTIRLHKNLVCASTELAKLGKPTMPRKPVVRLVWTLHFI